MNRDVFLIESRLQKETKELKESYLHNSPLATDFPKRNQKDYVSLHSKGFQTKENSDLFNHVLRLLLKDRNILKSEFNSRTNYQLQSSSKGGETLKITLDEGDIEYVPIEIKNYILDINHQETEVLSHIILMYEFKTGQKLSNLESETYSSTRLEEDMAKENDCVQEILQKVNDFGIESVSLHQMLKFKQIMRRRLDIFSSLKTHIEISGLLGTKPLTAQDTQLKEELRNTFKQIKDIAALRAPFYSSGLLGQSLALMSPTTMYPKLASVNTRGLPGEKDTDAVLGRIKTYMENVKTLDKIEKRANEKEGGKESPSEGSLSLQNCKSTPRKKRRNSSNNIQLKSWSEALNEVNRISGSSSLEQIKGLESIKDRRRMSSEGLSRQFQGEIGSESSGSTILDAEKRKKIKKLLKTQKTLPRTLTEVEEGISHLVGKHMKGSKDVTPMMIKEWRQKDLKRLKTYLSDNLMRSADKKTGQNSKKITVGQTEGDADDDKITSNKNKKKKKRNPNVGTSSGSVTTLVRSKFAAGATDKVDESKKQRLRDSGLIKEEEQEEEISPFGMPSNTEPSDCVTDEALKVVGETDPKDKKAKDDKTGVAHQFLKRTKTILIGSQTPKTNEGGAEATPNSQISSRKIQTPLRHSPSPLADTKQFRPLQARKFIIPANKSEITNNSSGLVEFQNNIANSTTDHKSMTIYNPHLGQSLVNTNENIYKNVYNLGIPGIDSKNLESQKSIETQIESNTARDKEIQSKSIQMLIETKHKPELTIKLKPTVKLQFKKEGSKTEQSVETSFADSKSRASSKDKSTKLKELTVIQNLVKKAVLKNVGNLGINSNELIMKTTKNSTISLKNVPKLEKNSTPRKSMQINEKSKLIETTQTDEDFSIKDSKKKTDSTNQVLEAIKIDGNPKATLLEDSSAIPVGLEAIKINGKDPLAIPAGPKPELSVIRGKAETNISEKEKPKIRLTKLSIEQGET